MRFLKEALVHALSGQGDTYVSCLCCQGLGKLGPELTRFGMRVRPLYARATVGCTLTVYPSRAETPAPWRRWLLVSSNRHQRPRSHLVGPPGEQEWNRKIKNQKLPEGLTVPSI